ncbi:sulfite reductase subunit alpha [Salmonella enterica subsp. enterica]|uniref:Sulfite reductase subunit alpha n=1 Tax=Salmonella enterica I TaxID=59201 RepID=A0A3S4IHA6_SALET|nr:sulfite reductase subunit alpha [Salmonella enterica subsp. enterica]
MNFSASPEKISTANWRNWAVNVCSTVSMLTLEYQAAASEWRARVVDVLKSRAPVAAPSQSVATGAVNDIHTSPYTKDAPLIATLSVNQKITGRNSEKDVRHIEIDLGDSGLRLPAGRCAGRLVSERSGSGEGTG